MAFVTAFNVIRKQQAANIQPVQGSVSFSPVMEGSAENASLWQAAPSGMIDLYITNPDMFPEFEVGDEYTVTSEKKS